MANANDKIADQGEPSTITINRSRTINLGAGPCCLPTSVLERASRDLIDYNSIGIGITEISHRSSHFQSINSSTQNDLRDLLSVPENFEILFFQGGGLLQFSTVVMNLVNRYRLLNKTDQNDCVKADYLITGSWSQKAAAEARRLGCDVNVLTDSRKLSDNQKSFNSIAEPQDWSFGDHKPAFIYYCDNETVDGVEFPKENFFPISSLPENYRDDVPIVADMSSNILSRSIPQELWKSLGIIFAGAQKNMGPAGLTVVIIRKDLMDFDCDESVRYGGFRIPNTLMYKNISDNQSLMNTPPMFSIYVCNLVFKDLMSKGGIEFIEGLNLKKSSLVYDLIDSSIDGFYTNRVSKKFRSRMNVIFNCKGGKEVEERFTELAQLDGIKQIKGHRSVGGIRFSLYNAITLEEVEKACEFMKKFMNEQTKTNQ